MDRVLGLDHRLERWVVHHRVDALDPLFVGLSRLGTTGFIWIVLALLAAFLWRRPYALAYVLVAVLTADLVALGLKQLTARPRPSVTYDEPEALVRTPLDLSFPSGHAATSFAAAAVLSRYERTAAVPLFVLAIAIAWSRVYVGVHYPSDVLAGAVLGVLVATALRRLAAALQRSPRARPGG